MSKGVKTIPIVKRTNTPFDYIYDNFPCLVVDKWEDVTKELLEIKQKKLTKTMEEFHHKYPDYLTKPEYEFFSHG